MTELLWFVGGLLFGGFVSTMFLCCLQLHSRVCNICTNNNSGRVQIVV